MIILNIIGPYQLGYHQECRSFEQTECHYELRGCTIMFKSIYLEVFLIGY